LTALPTIDSPSSASSHDRSMPMRSYAYTRVPTCTSPAITASSSPSTTSTGSDSGQNTPEPRIPPA
jgi:hypothetical protein